MGGPWNRRHVHRPGIKPLLLVQHMGPKYISITHRQHGVVVHGANQTKPGISLIRPGCSLPTNASPTRSPKGRLRPIRTPFCRARTRSVLHHSIGTNSPQTANTPTPERNATSSAHLGLNLRSQLACITPCTTINYCHRPNICRR